MTIPFSADLYQAVWPGGTVTLTQLFETFYGSQLPQPVSDPSITITAAAGGDPVLGPTSDGLTTTDEATYAYTWTPAASTAPGDYQAVFNGTGPGGLITYAQVITVAARAELTPAPGCYASVAQYRQFTGDQWTPTQRVQPALQAATETIDRSLIGARYAVDANAMPTDAGIQNVFMRATCAQAQFDIANNDPAHVKSQYSSVNVSGVSSTRTASAQGQVFPPLAPRAAQILQTVGALPGAPLLGWLPGKRACGVSPTVRECAHLPHLVLTGLVVLDARVGQKPLVSAGDQHRDWHVLP